MARILVGVLRHVLLYAIVVFIGAGTTHWPRAWVLLAVILATHLVGDIAIARANPELLAERAKGPLQRGQPFVDRVLLTSFIATLVVATWFAAADAWRWRLLPEPAPWLAALGLVIYLAGQILVTLALRANAFATMVLRHQPERGHTVVAGGPYRVVRHPMYTGLALTTLAVPLSLGSTAGVIVGLVPIAILAARIPVEERFLRRSLNGYAAYTARVRHRLVPWVW